MLANSSSAITLSASMGAESSLRARLVGSPPCGYNMCLRGALGDVEPIERMAQLENANKPQNGDNEISEIHA